jgi:hypothetical protein
LEDEIVTNLDILGKCPSDDIIPLYNIKTIEAFMHLNKQSEQLEILMNMGKTNRLKYKKR